MKATEQTTVKPSNTQFDGQNVENILANIANTHGRIADTLTGRTFKNTDHNCADDAVQVLFNNVLGDDTHVILNIKNMGKCSVIIGTSNKRSQFEGGGEETQIPSGANEPVRVKVRQGTFLMASCTNTDACDCNWQISNVRQA